MEQLAKTDLWIDYHPGPEAVFLDALSYRPNHDDYEGNLLSHTILTLEASCSILVVEPRFLHGLSSK